MWLVYKLTLFPSIGVDKVLVPSFVLIIIAADLTDIIPTIINPF